MFLYEEIIGIEGEEYIRNYDSLDFSKKILLIPELIDKIIDKADNVSFDFDIDENGFVNGYAISKDKHSFMTKRGKICRLGNKIKIRSKFSEDKVMVSINDICAVYYAIYNLHDFIKLPVDVINAQWSFSEGLALCQVRKLEGDYFNYIDDKGEIVSTEDYVYATSFVGGKALVKTRNGNFKFINKQFKTLMSFNNFPEKLCTEFVKAYASYNHNLPNDIAAVSNRYFYDGDLPLFVYVIIDTICETFGFTLESTDPKEQLTEALSLLAAKGTYMLDTKTMKLEEVNVVKGVKIKNTNSDNFVISYDIDDYAFLRSRIRSDGNE